MQKLYDGIGWETLDVKRRKHKLVLFYKIAAHPPPPPPLPPYLSSLFPRPDQNTSGYSLHNANNIRTIHSRINQYYNFFLPAVIRDWNDLPCSARIVDTVDDFKRQLSQGRVIVPNTLMQVIEACRYFYFSFFFVFSIYVCSFLHVKGNNYYLLINCYYLKRTIGYQPFWICSYTRISDNDHTIGKELNKLLCLFNPYSNPIVVFLSPDRKVRGYSDRPGVRLSVRL